MQSHLNQVPDIPAVAARTALVIETNNLRGGDDPIASISSMMRVVATLAAQSLPLRALAQLVITHDGLDAQARARITMMAGCPVDFVAIEPQDSYYDAKNLGFDQVDATRCDYVVFCDADCTPAADWLAQLLAPFADASAAAPVAVAGRTSYSASIMGVALTAIDFMYFPSTLGDGTTRNFYANNVAFKRDVFATYRYQALDGVYRGHCQVLGTRLHTAGVAVRFAPGAHTEHRLPDTRRELFKLRWLRGEDSVGVAPHIVRTCLPRRLHWLARSGPIGPLCMMAGRLFYSVGSLNRQMLPPLRGLQRPAAFFLLVGLSLFDTLGTLVRAVFGMVSRPAGREHETLSYHRH